MTELQQLDITVAESICQLCPVLGIRFPGIEPHKKSESIQLRISANEHESFFLTGLGLFVKIRVDS